jgi:hypothetical protein
LFGKIREMSVEPPRERTEPEDRTIHQRKTLRKSISSCDVRDLVRDNGVELLIVPTPPLAGKKNRGMDNAYRERHSDEFGFKGVRRRSKLGGSRAAPQPPTQTNLLNLQRAPP